MLNKSSLVHLEFREASCKSVSLSELYHPPLQAAIRFDSHLLDSHSFCVQIFDSHTSYI